MSRAIKISRGGQLEIVTCDKSGFKDLKLHEIKFNVETPMSIHLWINNASLTYLTIQEALEIRDALNESVKEACGL